MGVYIFQCKLGWIKVGHYKVTEKHPNVYYRVAGRGFYSCNAPLELKELLTFFDLSLLKWYPNLTLAAEKNIHHTLWGSDTPPPTGEFHRVCLLDTVISMCEKMGGKEKKVTDHEKMEAKQWAKQLNKRSGVPRNLNYTPEEDDILLTWIDTHVEMSPTGLEMWRLAVKRNLLEGRRSAQSMLDRMKRIRKVEKKVDNEDYECARLASQERREQKEDEEDYKFACLASQERRQQKEDEEDYEFARLASQDRREKREKRADEENEKIASKISQKQEASLELLSQKKLKKIPLSANNGYMLSGEDSAAAAAGTAGTAAAATKKQTPPVIVIGRKRQRHVACVTTHVAHVAHVARQEEEHPYVKSLRENKKRRRKEEETKKKNNENHRRNEKRDVVMVVRLEEEKKEKDNKTKEYFKRRFPLRKDDDCD